MNELFFVLFLLSGVIKPFLTYFHVPTGIDFTLLTAVALLAIAVRELLKNNFKIYLSQSSRYASILIFALFTLILLSLFYTSSEHYAYTKTLQFFTVLMAFFFPFIVKSFSLQKTLTYFLIFAIILSIVFLPLFIIGYKLFLSNYTRFIHDPIAPIYQSYLPMGYTIGIALIINFFHNPFGGFRQLIISIFLVSILITAGARGPLFSLLLIAFIFIIYKKFRFRHPRLSMMILSTVIILPLTFYLLNKLDITDLLTRTYTRIVTIKNEPSANDRLIRTQFVINHIDPNHLLLGYGFGSFGYEYSHKDERSYPHNLLLEIQFELGILGVLIYTFFIMVLIKHLTKTREFFPWAFFLFLFINSLKSLSLSDSRILFGFFALLLLYQANSIQTKLETKHD